MIRPLFSTDDLVRQHIKFLISRAWETRQEMEKEKVRMKWERRTTSAQGSRYRFIRLEIGWLQAMVQEGAA